MLRSATVLASILFLASSHLVAAEFTCPREGIFADPDNCQNFLTCWYHQGPNGPILLPEAQSCGQSQYFSDIYLICDYDYNVDCGTRPPPGGHPTGSPSTSTTTPFDPTRTTTTTTTTERTTTTTPFGQTTNAPPPSRYPDKIIGMYLAMADNSVPGFGTDGDWYPELYDYQQNGANVLFFSFIDPAVMVVPPAFERLAATRGTNAPGAVPADTKIMFAIGGYAYSLDPNTWEWLTSQSAAESMAEEVATWPQRYGCDGIDLDIEDGAGTKPEAGPNMIHFIRRLRQLQPNIIIGQPTYGFPQVPAETDVINASWRPGGASNNLADSVGLMVYEGTLSLDFVKNYAQGSNQWDGFPIQVDVPTHSIMVGCKGSASSGDIMTLARESLNQNLLGVMVWYASVINGFQFEASWDSSISTDSQGAYVAALQLLISGRDA